MAGTVEEIFINEEEGSYARSEFGQLGKETQRELMEAWFRERFEDPSNETPRWDGEFHFIWGGPFDPHDELGTEFGELVDDELIEELATKFMEEAGYEWAPTSKYQIGNEEPEEQNRPLLIGSPEERQFRDVVLDRLERLERLIVERPPVRRGMMGHNNPPEEITAEDEVDLVALEELVAEIKAALAKDSPQPADIAQQVERANGLADRFWAAAAKKVGLATDEFAKSLGSELGKAVVKLAYWGAFFAGLQGALSWLQSWLQAVGHG